MNERVLISVDLDFFNYVDMTYLSSIVSCAKVNLNRCTIQKDHLPDSYNAYPRHKAWKNYTIWNYDEHDDMGAVVGGVEEIGTWGTWLCKKGAKVVWVSEEEHAYRCPSGEGNPHRNCVELLIHRDDPPRLPDPYVVDGLAFFLSPGYVANDDAVIYSVFDALHRHDFIINGTKAGNWTLDMIKGIQ